MKLFSSNQEFTSEGRKEGRKKGRKEGRKEGRKTWWEREAGKEKRENRDQGKVGVGREERINRILGKSLRYKF